MAPGQIRTHGFRIRATFPGHLMPNHVIQNRPVRSLPPNGVRISRHDAALIIAITPPFLRIVALPVGGPSGAKDYCTAPLTCADGRSGITESGQSTSSHGCYSHAANVFASRENDPNKGLGFINCEEELSLDYTTQIRATLLVSGTWSGVKSFSLKTQYAFSRDLLCQY